MIERKQQRDNRKNLVANQRHVGRRVADARVEYYDGGKTKTVVEDLCGMAEGLLL